MARTNIMGSNEVAKKPKIERDTSINLPYDIIETILSRLPYKSVLRFKTVSKSWNTITCDQRFARIHLNHSKKSNSDEDHTHNLYIWQSYETGKYQVAEFDNQKLKFRTKSAFKFPLMKKYYWEHDHVLCTCDGFVLLKLNRESHNKYVLWNPTTKAYTLFFSPYLVNLKKTTFGICYDPSTDDYKVIFVAKKYYAVISCKSNFSPKKKEFPYTGISEDPGIFVNGVLYWVAIKRDKKSMWPGFHLTSHRGRFLDFNVKGSGGRYSTRYRERPYYETDDSYAHEIIYFDPIEDEFKEFQKPDGLEETDIIYLTTLRGCLCLYQNTYDMTMIRLWILDEGLWTKFMSIEDVPKRWPGVWGFDLVKPLCLTKNDDIVLQLYEYHYRKSQFVVYSYRKRTYAKVRNFCVGDHSNVIACLNSMVLPTPNTRFSCRKLDKVTHRGKT